jgi:hypothetical protein
MTTNKRGQAGGLALVAKRGREHMQRIGKRGAAVTWKRYRLSPVGTSNYALVSRETGEVKAVLNSSEWRK